MYHRYIKCPIAASTFFVQNISMSDSDRVQYKFMIPADLKDQLEEAAARSRRSLSAEIIVRLTESVRKRHVVSDDPLINQREMLRSELVASQAHIEAAQHQIQDLMQRLDAVETEIANRDRSAQEDEETYILSTLRPGHGVRVRRGRPAPPSSDDQ